MFLTFESKGEGSGSVIDRQGHVLTNFHVVEGAERNPRHRSSTATPTTPGSSAATPISDVAVLKIDAPPESLFPIVLGSSSNLLVGQRVFAIGNPFGFERTLSTGIISSLDRTLPGRRGPRPMKSIIQIDAAINPGSSGGPLLDSHGRMIGMNTAIASKTGEKRGRRLRHPRQHDRPRHASTDPERPGAAVRHRHCQGLSDRSRAVDRRRWRPAVRRSEPDCRARGSRRKSNGRARSSASTQTVNWATADMIVAVDGKPVKTADDFLTAVEAKQPGQQVVITVIRAGQQVDVPLTLGSGG